MKQTMRVFFNNDLLSHEKCWVIAGTNGTKYVAFGFYINFIYGRLQMDVTDGIVPEALSGFVDFYSVWEVISGNEARFLLGSYKKGAAEATVKNVGCREKSYKVEVEGADRQEVLNLCNTILEGKAVPIEVGKSFIEVVAELEEARRELEFARIEIRNREEARVKTLNTLNIIQAHYDGATELVKELKKIWQLPWYLRLAWEVGLYNPPEPSKTTEVTKFAEEA